MATESREDSANVKNGDSEIAPDLDKKYGNMSCFNFFLQWKRCMSSSHQFHQYYIYGELCSCKIEKERMYHCFKWKTMGKSKDEAKKALFESLEGEQTGMCDPGVPWKIRKEPPSDWKR